MKDGIFKNLVVDAYNKHNLVGILYGATSTYGLSDLTNFEEFLNVSNPDMLHLKSILTGAEIDVYEWELENYKIKNSESTIYIKLKNRPEVALMY